MIDVRSPWRPRDALVAVAAGFLGAALGFSLTGATTSVTELFALVLPLQAIGSIVVVWFLARRRLDTRATLRLRVRRDDAKGLLLGAGVQVGLSVVAYLVITVLLDGNAPTQELVEVASDAIRSSDRILVLVGLVVLGPVSEELIFRGVLLGALERSRVSRYAVVVSAGAFAALHLADPSAVLAVPFLFVLGWVLGNEVKRTGSLGRAVAIHAGFNLVTAVALLSA